jgi:hypothetical protein
MLYIFNIQSYVMHAQARMRVYACFSLELQIVTDVFLKVTVYPSLQCFPTESKECFSMPGEKRAMDAALFNSGMFNAAVWDDSIVAPLGSRIVSGF